jgi:tellurite methyltransferase
LAAERGLAVEASVQDMRHFALEPDYDLIVSMGCLHLVERGEWGALLRRLQACTRVGGYNAVGAMTDALPAPDDQRDLFIGLFKAGELSDRYAGWETISRRSVQFHDQHPGGISHHHAGDSLLARKLNP